MSSAVVVLSGGQDSTVCLFWATRNYSEVHAVTFDYNQRHKLEIQAAKEVAILAGVASHEIISIGSVLRGTSPLVSANAVEHYNSVDTLPKGPEVTFVPGRNALFLTLAANRAAALGAEVLITGVNSIDHEGYYDCRQDFIEAMQQALSLALYGPTEVPPLRIVTPVYSYAKSEIVCMSRTIPGCYEAMAHTHTCYDGVYPPTPDDHACLLRAEGFHKAGFNDPLIERAVKEGVLPPNYPLTGYFTKE